MIHHSRAPAHITQNEDDNGAHPDWFLKAPTDNKP